MRIVDEFPEDDAALEVATIQWPVQRTLRETRLARRQPSLLLIEPGAPVPEIDAVLEDWTLTTASFNELEARRQTVQRRAAALREDSARTTSPSLDLDGVLRVGDRSVILAPVEVRLLRAFLRAAGLSSLPRRTHDECLAGRCAQEQFAQRPIGPPSQAAGSARIFVPHLCQSRLHARAGRRGDDPRRSDCRIGVRARGSRGRIHLVS